MKREGTDTLVPPPAGELPWSPAWTADGVISVLEPVVGPERRARIEQVLAGRLASVSVLLESPRDPHNVAAVLRTADALGVQFVHVIGPQQSLRGARLVSRGSERWVETVAYPSAIEAVAFIKRERYTLVSAQAYGELEPERLRGIPRLVVMLGNEREGLSGMLLESADVSVRVPMRGFVESLNLSVCAAILLSHATRGRPGDLDSWQRRLTYACWLYRSVRYADRMLASLPPR